MEKMKIILIMVLGALLGHWFPARHKKKNELFQIICTTLLIFSMGVMLGSRENFVRDLSSLGLQSLLFCLIPAIFSLLLVYVLSRRYLEKRHKEER